MLQERSLSPSAKAWMLATVATVLAGAFVLSALSAPAGALQSYPGASPAPPVAPSPSPSPTGGAPPPTVQNGGQSYPNGSPFLEVPSASGWAIDDNVLPEQYATPGASGLVDTYLLQEPAPVASNRVSLQLDQGAGYATAIDSVSLESVSPGTSTALVEEGSLTVLSASALQTVVAAHDGSGSNVTSLLCDPSANASTLPSTYLVEGTGGTLTGSFGNVANAAQDMVVLRAALDPAYPPSGASGISVQVQNPATGGFTTLGFVAPREYFSDFALPIGSALGSGTQPIVLRLSWQGIHALAYLGLGTGAGTLPATQATLLSATGSDGANWTQVLATTNGQDAVLGADSWINMTFAVPSLPATGSGWAFVTNGAPLSPGGGPTASFTAAPISPTVGQSVFFNSTSTDSSYPITSSAWSLGDGTQASGAAAVHAYAAAGTYTVTLVVGDAGGFFSAVTQPVNVVADPSGGGAGPCLGAWACYRVNVTLVVGGTPGNVVSLTILSSPDCRRASDLAGASSAPTDRPCDCDRGSSGVLSPSQAGRCCGGEGSGGGVPPGGAKGCSPQFSLNVTRTSGSPFTAAWAELVLPWNASSGPDLDDEMALISFQGTAGTNPYALSFRTPFAMGALGGAFHGSPRHGGTQLRSDKLGQVLGLVLAAGYLVTFDATALPNGPSSVSVSWNFSGPSPTGGGHHGCAYANLTCELVHAGVPLGQGFPRALADHATCAALAGTSWDPLVCGSASGAWTTHLFVGSGPYTVTITIIGPQGTFTVVRTADAQIASVNGP